MKFVVLFAGFLLAVSAYASCDKPATSIEYVNCSQAGKIKKPKEPKIDCKKPQTANEFIRCDEMKKRNK